MTKAPNDAATDRQQTVADLQSRLGEFLARETATAEVMRLINASPGDLAPVFEAIVDKAMRFCDAGFGGLWLVEGDLARAAATRNLPDAYMEFLTCRPVPQGEAFGPNMKDRPAVYIADLAATELYRRRNPLTVASVELGGIRAYLAVPLRDGNTLAGVLSLCRKEVRPFTDRQIALVQTFADQAVIAIKNARLFNETKEALERQTATADILKVIASSPSDVQPVFEAIAQRSNRLVNGLSTAVYSIIDDVQHLMAFTPVSPEADAALKGFFPAGLSTFIWGETIRKGQASESPTPKLN